eukprot:m.204530 g.204530  ORF g.204530 m.204530 type:complete len:148 (+) comp17087_c0_seq30:3174-3617(+)
MIAAIITRFQRQRAMLLFTIAIALLMRPSVGHLPAPPSSSTIFNETKQLGYINLTWAAHCKPQVLANWSCFWCTDPSIKLVGTVHDNVTKLYGFVGFSPENATIIVSYRGSTNIANFFTDIDFKQVLSSNLYCQTSLDRLLYARCMV